MINIRQFPLTVVFSNQKEIDKFVKYQIESHGPTHLHYDVDAGTVCPKCPSVEFANGWNAAIKVNPTWKRVEAVANS